MLDGHACGDLKMVTLTPLDRIIYGIAFGLIAVLSGFIALLAFDVSSLIFVLNWGVGVVGVVKFCLIGKVPRA